MRFGGGHGGDGRLRQRHSTSSIHHRHGAGGGFAPRRVRVVVVLVLLVGFGGWWLFFPGSETKRRRKHRLWHPKIPGMGRRGKGGDQAAAAAKSEAVDVGAKVGGGAHADASEKGDGAEEDSEPTKKKTPKIAIVIPYLPPPQQTQTPGATPSLPPYFPVFARTAGGSASLVDFLIFHDGSIPAHLFPPSSSSSHGDSGRSGPGVGDKGGSERLDDPYAESYSLPSNVKLIDVGGIEGMARLFLRVADERIQKGELEMEEGRLVKILGRHVRGYPYVLVEFKAAYGHVFEEYLKDYTHWGYSDLDIAFGDLPRWITPDELTDYDIVTYGYGDQDRAYLRGQFTFHKNTAKTRQIWRGCSFLSEIDDRFARAAAGKDKLRFESAEGCYSHVVLHRDDLAVKYAVKGMNDLGDQDDTAYTHGLYVGVGSKGDRSVVWKAGPDEGDGARLRDLPLNWFEETDSPYADDVESPLQYEVGERTRVYSHRDTYGDGKEANCMFWAPKTYQPDICLVDVDPTDTVFLIDGELYKQPFERATMPGNVVSLSFYHFMEWKRYYRPTQLAAMSRAPTDGGIGGWVLGGEGAVPLPPASAALNENQLSQEKHVGMLSSVWRRRHRRRPSDERDRTRFPPTTFCLRSSRRKVPAQPAAAQCDYFASWRDADGVRIIHEGEDRTNAGGGDAAAAAAAGSVTLALTLELSFPSSKPSDDELDAADGLLALAESNVRAWSRGGQPSVLVVYAAGAGAASDEADALIRRRFGVGEEGGKKDRSEKAHLALCLVAVVSPPATSGKDDGKDGLVSRKALQNFAVAAAQTRWVVSGLELRRGLVLSTEAVGFAHRAAKSHAPAAEGSKTGFAFVLPQLAARGEFTSDGRKDETSLRGTTIVDSVSLPRLLRDGKVHEDSAVTPQLSSFDCVPCPTKKNSHDSSQENDLVRRMVNLWLEMTQNELSPSARTEFALKESNAAIEDMGRSIEDLELSVLQLLSEKNYEVLRDWDSSPIIMLDQFGPWIGARTFEIAAEVEEFGGGSGRCFEALRLAHLAALGYHVTALPGGFAMSTARSRKLACAGRETRVGVDKELSHCTAGCSMFENNELLEEMAFDERIRPAKAAIMWNELESVKKQSRR